MRRVHHGIIQNQLKGKFNVEAVEHEAIKNNGSL
jgi:hypothetical protein